MKNKEQFDNSIKVLVKAYLEGTLEHSEPCACAVGNLIADGMGHTIDQKKLEFDWVDKNGDSADYAGWYNNYESPDKEVLKEFNSTSYSIKEIIQIENAFEGVLEIKNGFGPIDTDGYRGLCAVFDVLVQIHKGSDKQLELAKKELIKK